MIDPMLRDRVWNPAFWWRVFRLGGAWRKCERCGFTSECLPYGESVRANRKALEQGGMPQPSEIRGPEEKKVCMTCCFEMREAHGDGVRIPDQQKGLEEPCPACNVRGGHIPGCAPAERHKARRELEAARAQQKGLT